MFSPSSVPVRTTMSIKICEVCEGPIELPDGHDLCVFCLGCAHIEMDEYVPAFVHNFKLSTLWKATRSIVRIR